MGGWRSFLTALEIFYTILVFMMSYFGYLVCRHTSFQRKINYFDNLLFACITNFLVLGLWPRFWRKQRASIYTATPGQVFCQLQVWTGRDGGHFPQGGRHHLQHDCQGRGQGWQARVPLQHCSTYCKFFFCYLKLKPKISIRFFPSHNVCPVIFYPFIYKFYLSFYTFGG